MSGSTKRTSSRLPCWHSFIYIPFLCPLQISSTVSAHRCPRTTSFIQCHLQHLIFDSIIAVVTKAMIMIASRLVQSLLLASAALAAPTMVERAGGPAAKPIPSSCSITSAGPVGSAAAFSLTSGFQKANQVYQYYLSEPSASDAQDFNETAKVQQCLEQCYGIGTGCTSILWAHNV
jgi:hypothetical protein